VHPLAGQGNVGQYLHDLAAHHSRARTAFCGQPHLLFTEQPLLERFERATVRPGSAALPASPAVKKNFARAWKRP